MTGDPGGYPGGPVPRQPGQPGTLDEHLPGHGLMRTGRLDPWGQRGPASQDEADEPLTDAEAAAVLRFPTYGDPELRPVEFVEGYARLAAAIQAQLAFVDQLLAIEYRRHGVQAFITETHEIVTTGKGDAETWDAVPTGVQTQTALLTWQGQLQARYATVLKDGIKIGIKAAQGDLVRRYGEWVAMSLQEFAAELGVDWDHPVTRRAAQRAVLRVRRRQQVGATDPDAAGPALSDAERAEIAAAPSAGTGS